MVMVLGLNLSPTKVKLLKLIFKHRGMTVEQATCGIYPREINIKKLMDSQKFKNQESKVNFIYKQLQKLRDKDGLLQTDSLHPRRANYYFLNRRGFEVTSTLLNIPIGKIGTGYSDDYGDFDYELYRPPHRQIHHHMKLIDFFLTLEHISANNPTYNIDYRDNRYISAQYPVKSPKQTTNKSEPKYKQIRPDGEFRLGDKWYWVEIDNGTEYFEALKTKFEGYAEYLDYLKENNSPIPEGIIFVTRDLDVRRWGTVTRSFFNGIGDWATSINLIAGTLSDIERIVDREVRGQIGLYNSFLKKIRYYFTSNLYKGTNPLEAPIVSNSKLGYLHVYSVTKTTEEHVAFVYEQVDGYETRGLARALEFKTSMNKTQDNELNFVSEVIPVLILNEQQSPPPLVYNSFTDSKAAEELFSNCYWLNVKDAPTWFDVNGQKIDIINPLVGKERV